MKINNIGPSGINPYKRQMSKIDTAAKSTANSTDKVEISSTAKEMQQLSQVSAARQEKIDSLKASVSNGTYSLNPQEIANSIVNYYSKN